MNPFLISEVAKLGALWVRANKRLLTGVAAAALLFTSGALAHQSYDNWKAERTVKAQVQTVIKEVIKRDEVERKVYVEDLRKVRALEAEKLRLSMQVAALQRKVDTYVPETPSSPYLSNGAVRLLDDAATGIDPASATAAAAVAAGQDTAPSDVTWRELVSSDLDVRLRFNQARLQCNALIDWVDLHVVNKK